MSHPNLDLCGRLTSITHDTLAHLEPFASECQPLGALPVAGQGLLTQDGPQVEQHRCLLVVDVCLRELVPGPEGVKPTAREHAYKITWRVCCRLRLSLFLGYVLFVAG